MRIIDWSSYVCSSDLQIECVVNRLAAIFGIIRAGYLRHAIILNGRCPCGCLFGGGVILFICASNLWEKMIAPREAARGLIYRQANNNEKGGYTPDHDMAQPIAFEHFPHPRSLIPHHQSYGHRLVQIGRATCRERVCQYV